MQPTREYTISLSCEHVEQPSRKVNAVGAIATRTLVRDKTGSRFPGFIVRDRNGSTALNPIRVGGRL
jgi:hypothetical protein